MNRQWLTIIKSKIHQTFIDQGLNLDPVDVASAIEKYAPKGSRAALGVMLDFIRPFTLGMGIQILNLSDTQIELLIPHRFRNESEGQVLHEGVIITGASEAVRTLWKRNAPLGVFKISFTQIHFNAIRTASSDLRVRFELTESSRESILTILRHHNKAEMECELSAFDLNEHVVAKIKMNILLQLTPILTEDTEWNS